MAEPSPRKKLGESVNAPGGKLKAWEASKWLSPAIMIQNMVPITPAKSSFEIHPMLVILRYRSTVASATIPIATNVAPETSQCNCNLPSSGKGKLQWRAMYCFSSPGQKYDAYPARPIAPDAIESGALKESCQTKRNEVNRPRRFVP